MVYSHTCIPKKSAGSSNRPLRCCPGRHIVILELGKTQYAEDDVKAIRVNLTFRIGMQLFGKLHQTQPVRFWTLHARSKARSRPSSYIHFTFNVRAAFATTAVNCGALPICH